MEVTYLRSLSTVPSLSRFSSLRSEGVGKNSHVGGELLISLAHVGDLFVGYEGFSLDETLLILSHYAVLRLEGGL